MRSFEAHPWFPYIGSATLFWFLFLLVSLSTLPWRLGPTPLVEVSISLPSLDPRVRQVQVAADHGKPDTRKLLTTSVESREKTLLLPVSEPGRLSIKAVALDLAGCVIYGGSVETVIQPPRWTVASIEASPSLHIQLKPLDVPLCN